MKLRDLYFADSIIDELDAARAIRSYLNQHEIYTNRTGRNLTLSVLQCTINISVLGDTVKMTSWKRRGEREDAPEYRVNLHDPDSFPKILQFIKTQMRI
jgi:hypothetical protein